MLPAIGQIVGVVLWGQADRISGNHKAFVLTGALATAAALALLAALGKPHPSILVAWLAVFGLLPAFLPVLIAHGRSVLPPNLLGRGMTLFNIGSMGGVFVVQLVSGALIDLFPTPAGAYPAEAYQLVFGAQAAAIVGASLLYLRAAR
jgi:MFS family permease